MERSRASMCFALSLIALVLSAGARPAAAEARWEPLPLWGGEVQIAAAQGGSPVVYAASPTAGLFESRDRGATWRFVSRGPNRFQMKIFGVDPHDPRRLFVMTTDSASDQRGLFRSEDGGRRWSRSDAGLAPAVSNLVFDPETPGTIWASTFEGLFRSVDGGRSWNVHAFDGKPLVHVAVSPSVPGLVFASVIDSFPFSLQRSTDGGETFTEVLEGAPDRIVFDPSQPQRVYGVRMSMVFRSDDLGLTWTSQETIGHILDLAVTRSGVLIAGGFNPGIRRSLDGGVTWEPTVGLPSPPYDAIGSLAVLGDLTLAGGLRGVWRSQNEGRGWRPSSTGIRAQQVVSLQVTGEGSASTVWVSTQADFFKGLRGGASFQSLLAPLGEPGGPYVRLFAVHPRQPDTLYALACCLDNQFQLTLLKSEDGGESWQRLPSYSGPSDPTVLEIDPVDPDIVYAGGIAGSGFCSSARSTDGGASWNCIPRFKNRNLTEIAIDPRQPQNLFAVAGDELFRSTDRGASWPQVPTATKGIVRLEVDPFRSGRLYALAGNKLLRSDNGGRTWTRKLEVRQPSTMRDLLLDPERRDRIWATAELSEPGQAGKSTSKVFRSDDAGQSWHEVSSGLGAGTVILDLAASPSSADVVFAGTAGQGLFRLETDESN